jgi:hypothetical protein
MNYNRKSVEVKILESKNSNEPTPNKQNYQDSDKNNYN